jgi:hypothetical protein
MIDPYSGNSPLPPSRDASVQHSLHVDQKTTNERTFSRQTSYIESPTLYGFTIPTYMFTRVPVGSMLGTSIPFDSYKLRSKRCLCEDKNRKRVTVVVLFPMILQI